VLGRYFGITSHLAFSTACSIPSVTFDAEGLDNGRSATVVSASSSGIGRVVYRGGSGITASQVSRQWITDIKKPLRFLPKRLIVLELTEGFEPTTC